MTSSQELLGRFKDIVVCKRGSQRAPHKPLLILLAIRYLQNEDKRLISFEEIEDKFKNLLIDFGPSRTSYHPEYPFWRLQNDGIWELENAENVEVRKSSTDAKKTELIKYKDKGGFPVSIYERMKVDNKFTSKVIDLVLETHFQPTYHNDLIQQIGLDVSGTYKSNRKKRDPKFRVKVLDSYSFRCSVCGFDLKYDNRPLALEAAHIQWHTHGGPNIVSNGLALCSQHHILFDIGVISITHNYQLILSNKIRGSEAHLNRLFSDNKGEINLPKHFEDRPQKEFLDWHSKEVFKKS